jgi:hypothetical protein
VICGRKTASKLAGYTWKIRRSGARRYPIYAFFFLPDR